MDKLYLFKGLASDSLNDTYPNYILISDYLRSDGIPKWSFRQGIGQNIFPFSFPDPFVSILYLLDRHNLAYGIFYMELTKLFLAGILFYLFLRKRSLAISVSIMGGLMYSFSSFMIIGSCWNLFSTEVVYLAFLLLAFEKYYQDQNPTFLPIAIALIAILQPFDLWLFGLFLFAYLLVRYYGEQVSHRKFFILWLRIALLALLGVGMSSFFFISEVRLMANSPRIGGAAGYIDQLLAQPLSLDSALHYITAVMRLFSSELLGYSNSFGGWYNFMEAPLFYCGLINLLLVPQLFQFLDERDKRHYGLWLALMVIPVFIPLLRYAIWLFTGNYYRVYSFFVAVLLMFFSLRALHFIFIFQKLNRKLLLITLGVLLAALYFPYNYLQHYDILNERLRNVVTVLLISYTGILLFLPDAKKPFQIQLLLLVLLCFELGTFSKMNVDERRALTREEYNYKKGYNDYTNEAIDYIKRIDKGFYRITKNYSSGPSINPSLNDSKIQRYKGTGSYHSFNQLHYVRFLAGMNIIDEHNEVQTRWITGLRNIPSLHSFMGVKYFLSKGPLRHVYPVYDSLTTIGNITIYRNKYAMPLGFTYNREIQRKKFDLLSTHDKEKSLYRAFILNDSIYNQYANLFPAYNPKKQIDISNLTQFSGTLEKLKDDTLSVSYFSNNHLIGTIAPEEKKMLFLSIPYSEGWAAKVDGKKQDLIRINIGFIGILLDKGPHTVELSYLPPLFYTGTFLSVFSILIFIVLIILLHKKQKNLKKTSI